MKKFFTIVLSLMALGLVSCDEEEWAIWDFAPINVEINVVDRQGMSLLDTARVDNVLADKFSITFDNKEYALTTCDYYDPFGKPQSRYYMPHLYGLYYHPIYEYDNSGWPSFSSRCLLAFGELDRTENFDYTMILHWPEVGRDYTLRVSNSFRWRKVNDPVVETRFWLDGVEIDGEQGVITIKQP